MRRGGASEAPQAVAGRYNWSMLSRVASLFLAAVACASAQEARSADAIVAQAASEAAASQRAVWVIFHASW